MKKKKIIVTGGHLTPAVAVIEKMQQEGKYAFLFIGRKRVIEAGPAKAVEAEVVKKLGVNFVAIEAGRLQRRLSRYWLISFAKIPLGFVKAFQITKKFQPDLILSFGGYLSVPVVFAGWLLGIPILTHEQTTEAGLANRINSLLARVIALSYPESQKSFPASKTVLTGNPIRKEFAKPKKELWRDLKLSPERPSIFITGGNMGSQMINQAVEGCLEELLEKYNIVHQCGYATDDYQRLSSKKKALTSKLARNYQVKKYLESSDMAAIMAYADLVVARSGANNITELAYLGKPCLLIPLVWGRSTEQAKNAEILKKAGIAKILPQVELSSGKLLTLIEMMMENLSSYKIKARKAQKLVSIKATDRLISQIKLLLWPRHDS